MVNYYIYENFETNNRFNMPVIAKHETFTYRRRNRYIREFYNNDRNYRVLDTKTKKYVNEEMLRENTVRYMTRTEVFYYNYNKDEWYQCSRVTPDYKQLKTKITSEYMDKMIDKFKMLEELSGDA